MRCLWDVVGGNVMGGSLVGVYCNVIVIVLFVLRVMLFCRWNGMFWLKVEVELLYSEVIVMFRWVVFGVDVICQLFEVLLVMIEICGGKMIDQIGVDDIWLVIDCLKGQLVGKRIVCVVYFFSWVLISDDIMVMKVVFV